MSRIFFCQEKMDVSMVCISGSYVLSRYPVCLLLDSGMFESDMLGYAYITFVCLR